MGFSSWIVGGGHSRGRREQGLQSEIRSSAVGSVDRVASEVTQWLEAGNSRWDMYQRKEGGGRRGDLWFGSEVSFQRLMP